MSLSNEEIEFAEKKIEEKKLTQEEVDSLPAKKEDLVFLEMWPGYIPFMNQAGTPLSGCKSVVLGASNVEEYFKHHPGMLVVDWKYCGTDSVGEPHFAFLYTKRVSDDDMTDFNEVHSVARELMDMRKAKREEAKEKAAEENEKSREEAKTKAEEELKELQRLAALGRKHEKNCKKGK